MNDQAIYNAYQTFSQGGYNGSIDDFKQLIATNPNALNNAYDGFKLGGYNGDVDDFKSLMGVDAWSSIKKKIQKQKDKSTKNFVESRSESGLSVLQGALDEALPDRPKPKTFMSTIDESIDKDLSEKKNFMSAIDKSIDKDLEEEEILRQRYDTYDDFFDTKQKNATGVKAFIESTDVTKDRDQFGNENAFDLGLGKVSNDTKYRVKDGLWERLVNGSSAYEKITNAPSIIALNNRYNRDISTDVAPIVVNPSVIDPFLSINSDFLSKTEENAQTVLEKKFGDMGFIFEQTGYGTDYIKVIPKNGAEPMTFSFDEKSGDEAVRLQSFLRNNASFEKEGTAAGTAAKIAIQVLGATGNYNSEEYKALFKDLTYLEKKEEIIRRQQEGAGVKYSEVGGIIGLIKGSEEDDKKVDIASKKALDNLYNSEEFKLFNSEKSKFEKQQEDRYSLLLDNYEIKKQSGDTEGARQAKLAIESGFSKDVIGDNLTNLSNSQYDLMNAKNELNAKSARLQAQASNGLITQAQYNIAAEAIIVERKKLAVAAESIVANQKKMTLLAGEYVLEKAKYGNFGSNFVNAFVVGTNEVGNMLVSSSINMEKAREESKIARQARVITPQQQKYYEDKGYNEQQIKNVLINKAELASIKANKKAAIERFGSDLTTEESKQELGFVENALVGVAASLPSMLMRLVPGVGASLAFTSMANMSYNAINEEMLNDSDFETTSKRDRAVVAVPYSLVMGALENVGLKNMTAGKAGFAAKYIMAQAAKLIPKGATREVAENIINKEVKNIFAKGAIKIVNGTLAEFETGVYQTAALDIGLKQLYNAWDPLKLASKKGGATGGELFDTPDTKMGVASAILEGGLAEAIGGMTMSTVIVGAQGFRNGNLSLYDREDLKFFKDFSSDEEFKKLIVTDLKTKMLQGTMTKSEAQAALNDIDLVAGVFNSIDENLPDDAKIEAFNLINERSILEREVAGKDPSLSKKRNDRIAEINARLEELPSIVQEDNLTTRAANIQDALRQRKNKSNTIRLDGQKVDRVEAEAELQTIITKLEGNAIQKQAASEVLVQPTTTIGEEVVQGEPTTESQVLAEEGQKRKEITKALEDLDDKAWNEIYKLIVPNYTKAINEIEALNLPVKEYNKRVGKLNKQYEQELSISIEEAYTKGKKDGSYPELVKAVEELLAPATQELVSEEVIPQADNLTIGESLLSIEAEKAKEKKGRSPRTTRAPKAPVVTAPAIVAEETPIIVEPTQEAVEITINDIPTEQSETNNVKTLNGRYFVPEKVIEEAYKNDTGNRGGQTVDDIIARGGYSVRELDNLLPNWKELTVELNKPAVAPVVTAPVVEVKAEAPKAEGTPTTFSWSKIEQYDDTVIREMMRAQNAKLETLLALENKTTKAQKEEIRAIKAKIVSANKILDARANKEKRIEKNTEKGKVTDKSPRVSGFDQNGKPAEFGVVVDKNGQTAKVQLKKRGTQELARQKTESNLKIQTDNKGKRFVETQNKSRVYIDEKVTPPKAVELTAFGVPVSTKQEYSKENPKIIENENDAIEIEKINKDLYTEKISNLDIIKEGGKWVVRTQTEGREEFTGKTLKEAKDYLANRNLETRIVGFKEAAPVTEVKAEAPKVEPVVEPKAEPVKKSTVTAEDTMGAINSIKEEIDAINNEIKREKEKARKAVNEIEAKILETKNENRKEELQFDIEDIETQLEEDLEGLKDDLDRQVEMLKEEVDKFQDLDAKTPENKKTLLDYLYKAKESLRKLDRLTYTKVDFGISVKTAKLIVDGLIKLVEGGITVKAAIKQMAAKYKAEGATIENINKYLDSTYVEKQTNQESLQKERDKFVEIREAVRQARVALKSESKVLRTKAATTIKTMLKGKVKSISAVQMKSIMTRLASFNVFNQTQYDKFLEYVDKVIEITNYDAKVREANVKRKNAKNNTIGNNPKLGDLSLDLLDSLSRMLNINPKLISKEVFDSYYNIVDDLSKRTTILSPGERADLNEKVNEIVDSIEQNEEMLPDLKDTYDNYADKVVDNFVDYAKTLTKMLEDGIINSKEFALIKKYTDKVVDKKVANYVDTLTKMLQDGVINSNQFALMEKYADKVVENKVVNYAKTLSQMLEDGTINNNEFALMKKYKSRIVDAKVKVKMTEQEIADEKAELINEITNTPITLNAIVGDEFRLERELVKRLAKLLNKESLENLDNKQLKNLIKIIENINDGFVSKSTQQMVEILNEKKNASLLETSIPKSVKGIFKKITQPISGVLTRDKYGVNINPLFNIDEVFGDFKTKNIFNSVLKQSAVSQQQFQSEVAEIQGKLIKAESAIASSFNRFSRNENKIQLSKFKMMVYMMQLEFESNPSSQKGDKKQVNQAMKTLDATIDFAETNTEKNRYTKEDIAQMKAIKKEFGKESEELEEDGTKKKIIDIDKLYKSFNNAEKNALKVFDEINSLMTKKATYTATVINGNKIAPLKNYIYYNTISDSNMSEVRINSLMESTNPNQQKGTESKNLEERTGEVSPVNLDPYRAVNSSAKSVLVNYHMTEPIRTARKTLSTTRKTLEKNKKNNENVGEQFEILSVIERAYDTATRDLLETNLSESSDIDAVVQYLTKTGYRAMLGSVTRATAELISNIAFVTLNNPRDMASGWKYRKLANSGKGKNILTNLKSKVTSRNYPVGGLSSNYVDVSAFKDRTVRDGKSRTKYVNGVKQVFDFTVGNWVNAAELLADNLISRPDQVVMKQLYFGAFSREFKKETGIEPDFKKIEANDEEYMDKYQDALEKATNQADNQTVTAGSSTNAYMGILQNVVRKEDSGRKAVLKTFNQFMNRFTIQEYITARKGVYALVKRGDITQAEGIQVLAAVSARMTLYLTFGKVLSQALIYLAQGVFGWGDDDDEDEGFFDFILDGKTPLQVLYQSAVSSATTLFFGRNYGNVVRSFENLAIEQANKEYGEDIGLRNGEYDPFKDALQFNQFSKVDELSDVSAIMAGPLGPIINAGTLGIKLATKEAPVEDRAIETRRKEWYRFGLEAAGSIGLVPFYRDVRKVQMDWVYDELKKELKEDAAKKVIKDEKDASTLETKTNTLNRMRVIHKDGRSRSIIDDELRKLNDPDFKKQEYDKEEAERKRLLDKYGYDSQEDFKRNEKEKYDKVFGDDSPYRKRLASKAKIQKELKDRMDAAEDNKTYRPKVEKKKEKKFIDPLKTNALKTNAFKTNAFKTNAFETDAFN